MTSPTSNDSEIPFHQFGYPPPGTYAATAKWTLYRGEESIHFGVSGMRSVNVRPTWRATAPMTPVNGDTNATECHWRHWRLTTKTWGASGTNLRELHYPLVGIWCYDSADKRDTSENCQHTRKGNTANKLASTKITNLNRRQLITFINMQKA